jgi:hypothetical protein
MDVESPKEDAFNKLIELAPELQIKEDTSIPMR